MTPEEKHQRGVLANQVLENPIYKEAIIKMKADIFEQWADTKWFQHRKRNELWKLYRAAEALEHNVEKIMKRGVQADKLKLV